MIEQELLYDLKKFRNRLPKQQNKENKKQILVSGGDTEIFVHDIISFIYQKIYKYSFIEIPEEIREFRVE